MVFLNRPHEREDLSANTRTYQQIDTRTLVKGSLSNSVFERRTSTGSELFASLGSGLVETLE